MSDTERPAFGEEPLTPSEEKALRKKKARKARIESEKRRGRDLDALADEGVTLALALAAEVADAKSGPDSERVVPLEVTTYDEAQYVRRRINQALAVGEWLDEVDCWVWQADVHARAALTDHGRTHGVEVRLEQPRMV